jgi:RNA polymerase sigma-70 factor, ECF subfamily
MTMTSWNQEERLLRDAVLAGDAAAWRALYDRAFLPLYTWVWFRTGRDADRAMEVVQESWLVAVRRIRHFDPDRGTFNAWMRGIAAKVLLSRRRKWRRRAHYETDFEALEPMLADPADTGRQTAVAELVAVAMAALPDHYRDVLHAKYGLGRSLAEIAADLGQSDKAVESLLTRARNAFRTACSRLEEEWR